ncbi:hypothetical protein MYX07_03680 [Patescibacteria group bacterium AH-259-L07]|nr:hypothetical protein [Patescibacteria group bacterium AH-259-L07]
MGISKTENFDYDSDRKASDELERERRTISDEEQTFVEKIREVGGEGNLSREDYIRLIALRYMREQSVGGGKIQHPLSEEDAMELATIERDITEAGGESKVAPEVFQRKMELRKKL